MRANRLLGDAGEDLAEDRFSEETIGEWWRPPYKLETPVATTRTRRIAESPLPLFPPLPPPELYPVEALGPILSPAAAAISRKVQVPLATAAQSVLAVAALAAQGHADVMLPYRQTRPLSLFLVTVAASGDRKTTADTEALRPVRRREEALALENRAAWRKHDVHLAAWRAERRKIEGDKKLNLLQRTNQIASLGPEPKPPIHPFLVVPEPTVEGLIKNWPTMPASLGLFTTEGGQFVGGHGMNRDNRTKTAATFSDMWDGAPIRRIRVLDGVTLLDDRRLSMHLMLQPDLSAQFLSDPSLRDQGLLSRVLVAAPLPRRDVQVKDFQ
jgi:hypothetical protein